MRYTLVAPDDDDTDYHIYTAEIEVTYVEATTPDEFTTYNEKNQIQTVTADGNVTTYSYDADGNLATVNAAGSRTTYSWDYENRMESVILPSGDRHTFAYDP